ncbi:iron ABC transporter permease [Nocardioides sp. AE5]|uniref:ABC transporter permease n=1 Tax=Nocardioides sp. AE5 TaxID=2962573 RepID=UPI002882A8BA|nr:iron ABC transporter permease [Nocardioides sp. AE5]MDT0202702.1 iron ABC transporter permease [Nocardioides sp. AE5]
MSKWLRKLPLAAFVAVLAYFVVWPLVMLQQRAVEDGGRGYDVAFNTDGVGQVIWDTILLAGASTLIATVLGTGLAWAVTRLPSWLQWMRVLPLLPIVMPMVAVVLGWTFLLSPRPGFLNSLMRKLPWWNDLDSGPVDVYSFWWIVLITGFALTAFVFLFVSTGMQNVSADHVEAAHTNGARGTRAFFTIVFPLLRPSLIQGIGVSFLLGIGQFTAPLLLGANSGIDVVATWMLMFTASSPIDYGAAAAIGSPLLVVGLVVIVAQRVALGDQGRFVTHGGKGFRSAGKPSVWAVLAVGFYFLVSTLLPLLALVVVALSPYWTGTPDTFTLDNIKTVLTDDRIVDAIRTSIVASLGAALLILPVGFVAALVMVRNQHNRVLRWLLDVIVALPLGVPAVVFGVGFLLAYTTGPFILYGTTWVMVLVYATLMLPFATRTLLSGLIALGDTYIAASRTCGASPFQTGLRILMPLLRGSIAGAGAIIFVMLTHEFSASLLVRAPTVQVMGTLLYDYWTNGMFPVVAAMALVMTAVTGIGVAIAMLIGGRNVMQNL